MKPATPVCGTTSNGRKIEDPWLEQTVSRLYRLPSVSNSSGHRIEDIKLTDDLKYVVYWASQSFDWNGRKYGLTEKPYRDTGLIHRSQDHAVSFERPNADGVVFDKGVIGPILRFSIPLAICLYKAIFACRESEYESRRADKSEKGETRYSGGCTRHKASLLQLFSRMHRKVESSSSMVFIIPKPFQIGVWGYEKGTFETRDFDIYSLIQSPITFPASDR